MEPCCDDRVCSENTQKSIFNLLRGGMEKQTHEHRAKQAPLLIQLPSSYISAQGRRGPTARLLPVPTTQGREST